MPRCLPILIPFLDRFFIDFYSQVRHPESRKSSPRCRESTIFQKIAFRSWHGFLFDFRANMPPFSLPKSSKIAQKPILNGIVFLIDFYIDFKTAQEGSKTAQDAPRRRSKRQDGPKRPPRRPQDGPKRPQKFASQSSFFDLGRQGPPRAPRDPSKTDFWSIFGRFLVDFWLIFGRFLIHFSVDFLLIDFFASSLFYFQLF